jgi:hypothetical protein
MEQWNDGALAILDFRMQIADFLRELNADFRFRNVDFRFKSSKPRGKECMQPQSAIYNHKS